MNIGVSLGIWFFGSLAALMVGWLWHKFWNWIWYPEKYIMNTRKGR